MSATKLVTIRDFVTARRHGLLFFVFISTVAAVLYRDFLFFNKGYLFLGIASDSLYQFYPLLYYYSSHILDLSLRFWSFDLGLGAPTITLLHDLFGNPLYIFAIAAGPENLPRSLAYIAAANVIIAGMVFYAFMRSIQVTPLAAAYAGMAYAFSAYVIGQGFWHHFPNYAIFLALMLLLLERLMKTGSWLPFVLVLGFLEIKSVLEIGQMLIFLSLYLVYRRVDTSGWNTISIVGGLVQLYCFYGLGCALNAVFSLPNLYALFQSDRVVMFAPVVRDIFLSHTGGNELFTFVARLFSNEMLGSSNRFSGWMNYLEAPAPYVGVLTIILAILAILHARRRHLAASLILAAAYAAWVFFPAVLWVMNAGQAGTYKHTNLYFGTVLIMLAAGGIDRLVRREIKIRPVDLLSIPVLMFMLAGLLMFRRDLNGFLNTEFVINKKEFALAAAYLVTYAALLTYAIWSVRKSTNTDAPLRVLLAVGVSEIIISALITVYLITPDAVNADFQKKGENYFEPNTLHALAQIKNKDRGFYRTEKSYLNVFLNDNLIQGYHGVAAYLGYNDASTSEFYKLLDLPLSQKRGLSGYRPQFGDRWITQSLVDVKYYLVKPVKSFMQNSYESNSSAPYNFESVTSSGPITIYRNNSAFGLGAIYDSCFDRHAFEKYSPEQREALLTKAVVLAQCPSNLRKLDMDGAALAKIVGQPIPLTADRITAANLEMLGGNHVDTFNYVSTSDDRQLNLDLRGLAIPNLLKIEIVYDDNISSLDQISWRQANEPFGADRAASWLTELGHKRRTFILDPKKADFVRIAVGEKGAKVNIASLQVSSVDPKVAADALAALRIQNGSLDIISGSHISGKIRTEKPGLLFVSVPYNEGWSATVNGRPVRVEKANIAFIGIPVGAGENEITLRYFPPWLKSGLVISGLSFLMTIVLFLRYPRARRF